MFRDKLKCLWHLLTAKNWVLVTKIENNQWRVENTFPYPTVINSNKAIYLK